MTFFCDISLLGHTVGADFDSSKHQITNVLTADPTCGSEETHASRSQQSRAKATRTRSSQRHRSTSGGCAHRRRCVRHVAARCRRHGDQAAGRRPSSPVNPLMIGRLQASGQRLALEDGVDTSVAVGWQLGDERLDLATSLSSGSGGRPIVSSVALACVRSDWSGRLQSPPPRHFSRPCIIGYGSSPSRCGPAAVVERSIARSPGS